MPPAFEVLLLNTAIPQIQAAQSGDTYVVPRDIAFSTVANLANCTNLLPSLTFSSDTNTGIYREGADALGFTAGGGTNLMVLTTTGLGIGTNNPGAKLDVDGTVRAQIAGGGTGRYLDIGSDGSGTTRFFNNYAGGGDFGFVWRIGASDRMTLDASGNLGLGETNPAAYGGFVSKCAGIGLHTNSTSGAAGLNLYEGGTGRFSLRTLNGSAGLSFFDSFNGTERARITAGGSLLVGATTEAGYLFRVAGGLSQFYATAAANFPVHVWNSAASGDNGFVNFYTDAGATLRGSIDYDRTGGLVRYNTTSDYRAKDIIGPIQNVGATIDALKVYEGKMKGATQSRPMLVAHEAQEYAPYAVTGEKDAMNEDGTPKYQQMDVSSLVPLLLAELQSLRARVAALESKP